MADQNSELYRRFWRWHFYAAILVVPFVLWQSATGTLYLWSEWWMDLRHPELRFVQGDTPSAPYAAQIASVLAREPGGHVSELVIPADPSRSTTVIMSGAGGLPYPVFINPRNGQVLGTLTTGAWLPGLTRALHAGWPAGMAGALLLELGDCWAIVMLATGLYLWWPRGRSFLSALWPRFGRGPGVLLRDLHSCVAVWFSLIFAFFLISALPWTMFWGGTVLPRIERGLGQTSEIAFQPGGASAATLRQALPTLDAVIAHARATGVTGDLLVRLAPWEGANWWLKNENNPVGTDRYLLADTRYGVPLAEIGGAELPAIRRLVALGIHVHQGDFGPVNRWLNTALAAALIWLSVTGILSWWRRKPQGQLGAPPRVEVRWPRAFIAGGIALCALLPLLALSVVALAAGDFAIRSLMRRPAL